MRAVVLDAPGPPSALAIRELPVPDPPTGWVLIKVKAFGLNRSELHTRLGLAQGVTFPRVLGIEAAGVVARCPGGEFPVGQQVVAMMGGMGRVFDGGYAEYTSVPATQVIAFHSDLDWATLGALPEMLQTSYGSLTIGLDAQPEQSILIRGGTSSVGMATAVLAKQRKMFVLSTTRNPNKAAALANIGVDHVLIDDGDLAGQVRRIVPDGVDAALELVGTPTLPDTLRSVRVHGVVCFTGSPTSGPCGTSTRSTTSRMACVTAYGGDANDLSWRVLQEFLDAVAAREAVVPIDRVYGFDQIAEAHAAMEADHATGKLVVVI
jgi:NADPH:quinone reductase